MARAVENSRFAAHARLITMQGIAIARFNVVDIAGLRARLDLPVLVVTRRVPDLKAVQTALLNRVRPGRGKWRMIERPARMEPARRAGWLGGCGCGAALFFQSTGVCRSP